MLYSQDKGVLFLEVPKTGTVAVATAVRGICRQYRALPRHVPAHRARREFTPERWKELKTVAFVREPTAWLRSWYRYANGIGRIGEDISFNSFVELVAHDAPINGQNIGVKTQFERISDRRQRRVIVSRLLCFEHLADEYNSVNAELLNGEGKDLTRKNVSPRKDAQIAPETEQLISERWAIDAQIWAEVKAKADRRMVRRAAATT